MKRNSIFKQAAFLAAAGILVRIIGLLYRSPLTKLIGFTRNGVTILLLIMYMH